MTTDMQAAFEHWVTTVWRPDDGAELLKRDYPRMALAAWKAALAPRPDAQADERGAKLYRFIEAPEHILVGDEIWAQRSSVWRPVTPDFVDTEYSDWMPPIRRAASPQAPNTQHEKSDLYKEGYAAGKKAAQESFSKLISCDPNDEALGLICEALSLKPEGDITEAILGAIEELKTKAAQGVPSEWRELCRRLYVELFHCDQQMRSTRDQDGEPHWTQSAVVCDVLKNAKAALAAPSPAREQVGEPVPGSPAFALRGLYKLATEYFIDGKPATPDEYIAWQRGIVEALTSAKLPDPMYYGTQDEDGDQHEVRSAYVDGWNQCRASILAKDASPSRERGEAKKSICDFLDAPSMWAQVYCCAVFVRAFTSDMARGAADHAVQEFGSDACKTVADLEYTLDEVLRAD